MSLNRSEFFIRIRKLQKKIRTSPQLFFVATASVFGLLFLVTTPPLQGPDEQAHFAQVYRYSEGTISATGSIPKSVADTYKTVLYEDDLRFKGNEKYELGRTKHALLEIPLHQDQRVDGAPYGGTVYSPLVYLPQILLVFLGRLSDLPAIILIYLARLGSLLMFVGLMFVAIKAIPVAKWAFAVIGVLPMTVFTAAVVSSDGATIGATALFISLILRVVTNANAINKMNIIQLTLVTILLASTKLVNILLLPLLALLLFKKADRHPYKRLILSVLFLLTVGLITTFAWQIIAPTVSDETVSNIPKNVVPSEQIRLMMEAPQKFLFALWNTYFYAWGDGISYSLIGTFGWIDTPMSAVFIICGYIALVLVLLANRNDDAMVIKHLNWLPRTGIGLVIVTYLLGVNAAMFIYYSPPDFNIIVGLQGRYFLPILFLLAITLINKGQVVIREKAYMTLTMVAPVMLLLVAEAYIFIRYYVDTRI